MHLQNEEYSFDERLSHASTIPSVWYTSGEVHGRELSQIFRKTWQLAGRADRVAEPGDYFTVRIAHEPVIVVCGADRRLRALSNVCRHRAGPVAAGKGKRSAFQCGYHGWTYSLDGRLLVCPEFEGVEAFEQEANALPEFRVESLNGFIFVNLDSNATPASVPAGAMDAIGALPPYRLAAHKDWFLDCNWKVYVDNYLEGYHIPIVHPGLNRELDYTSYQTEIAPLFSLQHAALRRNECAVEARYYWIFPNLMVNVYPGNFSTNLIVPVGPERTQTIFDWYFPDPDTAAIQDTIRQTVEISTQIQHEDIAVCESVQQGLRSATYKNGRYSAKRESGVHHFHGLLSRFLDGQ